jgi:hypothetical protein
MKMVGGSWLLDGVRELSVLLWEFLRGVNNTKLRFFFFFGGF